MRNRNNQAIRMGRVPISRYLPKAFLVFTIGGSALLFWGNMERQKYKHQVKTNYEAKRDLLIPVAERFADAVCGKESSNTSEGYRDWVDLWNRVYHQKMNELARGL